MTDEGSENGQQEHGQETVGETLKAAREKHGFDRQEVADQLHLRPAIIKAIEEGDYQSTPEELFLKGYVRSYARLTGQDGDDLVHRLDSELIPLRREEQQREPSPTEIIRQRKERRRLIGGIVIAVVAVASVVWVTLQHGHWVAVGTGQLFEETTEGNGVESEQGSTGSDDTGSDGDESAKETSGNRDEESGTTPSETTRDAAGSTDATIPTVQAPVDSNEPERVEPVEEGVSVDTASLRIEFEEPCWMEVVNGNDERVIVRLAEAGEVVEYSGPGPLEVLLGNVEAVAGIRFRGEPVDLEAYPARSGRTQFVLGANGSG